MIMISNSTIIQLSGNINGTSAVFKNVGKSRFEVISSYFQIRNKTNLYEREKRCIFIKELDAPTFTVANTIEQFIETCIRFLTFTD